MREPPGRRIRDERIQAEHRVQRMLLRVRLDAARAVRPVCVAGVVRVRVDALAV
jgi:hypothetical protein